MSAVRLGAVTLLMAVVLGAFGAHGLKARVAADAMKIYETGVFYHFVHGLAILILGFAAAPLKNPKLENASWVFALGILVFSGSLYGLALGGPRALGMITPVGGIIFILGWLLVAFA